MSRYFAAPRSIKPRLYWDDDAPMLPSLSVDDHVPIDTGLLDYRGDTIWRAPEEIGFHKARGRNG